MGSAMGRKKRRGGSRARRRPRAEADFPIDFAPAGPLDEPRAEGDDWVEWGGELMLEMGSTEGGAPYGLSLEEFRESNERHCRAGWARAKRVLREVLVTGGKPTAIRWVRHVSSGLSYDVYCADCTFEGGKGRATRTVVVRLPRRSASPGRSDRGRRELRVLEYLGGQHAPLRLPSPIGWVSTPDGIAFAQEAVFGLPLDLRAGRQCRVRPWEVVATAAVACHEVDPVPLCTVIPYFPTRRDHAAHELSILAELCFTEAAEALAWARENLPRPEPSRLLHGDLLGQNILLDIEGDGPPGLLDWEYAHIGDPAYDLAIVTKGARRPFQIADGLERLLGSYNEHAKTEISREQVHLYELCLKARFFLADTKRYGEDSAAAHHARNGFISVLRRATRGTRARGP